MTAYDFTTVLTTGANAGYMPDRLYQVWEGQDFKPRRHVLFVGQPDFQGATPTAADTVKMVTIGAGTYVLMAFAQTITAGPATSTISLGDSGSATQFLSALSVAATGTSVSATSTAKYYTAADYLLVTLGTTVPTGAVISVGYVGMPINLYGNQ